MSAEKMTNSEAFALARRKATKGHRDWVVYKNRDGSWTAQQRSASSIKAAMLASGTKQRWHVISASTGVGHIQNWALGCRMLRNARIGY
jgi:hypothetical protein